MGEGVQRNEIHNSCVEVTEACSRMRRIIIKRICLLLQWNSEYLYLVRVSIASHLDSPDPSKITGVIKKCSDRIMEVKTCRPFRKLWQIDRSTNRPLDRLGQREVSLPIRDVRLKKLCYYYVLSPLSRAKNAQAWRIDIYVVHICTFESKKFNFCYIIMFSSFLKCISEKMCVWNVCWLAMMKMLLVSISHALLLPIIAGRF